MHNINKFFLKRHWSAGFQLERKNWRVWVCTCDRQIRLERLWRQPACLPAMLTEEFLSDMERQKSSEGNANSQRISRRTNLERRQPDIP